MVASVARALCEWRAVNVSSLAIGWVSVVKWQSIAQYCRRKPAGGASASFSENSEGSELSGWLADARDIGGVVSLLADIVSNLAEMGGILW